MNTSELTIFRALNFYLKFNRKMLTKVARKDAPEEFKTYYDILRAICSFPEQLVSIDEMSKDKRDFFMIRLVKERY